MYYHLSHAPLGLISCFLAMFLEDAHGLVEKIHQLCSWYSRLKILVPQGIFNIIISFLICISISCKNNFEILFSSLAKFAHFGKILDLIVVIFTNFLSYILHKASTLSWISSLHTYHYTWAFLFSFSSKSQSLVKWRPL